MVESDSREVPLTDEMVAAARDYIIDHFSGKEPICELSSSDYEGLYRAMRALEPGAAPLAHQTASPDRESSR